MAKSSILALIYLVIHCFCGIFYNERALSAFEVVQIAFQPDRVMDIPRLKIVEPLPEELQNGLTEYLEMVPMGKSEALSLWRRWKTSFKRNVDMLHGAGYMYIGGWRNARVHFAELFKSLVNFYPEDALLSSKEDILQSTYSFHAVGDEGWEDAALMIHVGGLLLPKFLSILVCLIFMCGSLDF